MSLTILTGCKRRAHQNREIVKKRGKTECLKNRGIGVENRNPVRRRHRPRGRSRVRQGHAGRRRADRARDRLAGASHRQARARGARRHASRRDRAGASRARRLDHGADRARGLSARRSHLGDAGGAQALRAVRRGAARALAREHRLGPQERRHRLRARADRGHALFRDGDRRRGRVPAQRRHHGGDARDNAQGLAARRARSLRDRAHAAAQESDRGAQGAGLPARLWRASTRTWPSRR